MEACRINDERDSYCKCIGNGSVQLPVNVKALSTKSWQRQSVDACFSLSDVQPPKTCSSSLCAHLNIVFAVPRGAVWPKIIVTSALGKTGETVNASRWSEGAAATGALGGGCCVSAAGVNLVLACVWRWQGSCCKGFRRKITGQSALLGGEEGAGSIGFFSRGALPKCKHEEFKCFGGCGYACTTFQVVVQWKMSVLLELNKVIYVLSCK